MSEVSWSLPVMFLVAVVTLFMVVMTIAAWIILRRLERLRRRTDERLDLLSERLRRVEREHGEGGHEPGTARHTPFARGATGPMHAGNPSSAGPTLIAVPDLAEPDHPVDPGLEAYFQERHGEVWTRAAAGATSEEIARQTGQPIGQVELIMGLFRQVRTRRGRLDHAQSH